MANCHCYSILNWGMKWSFSLHFMIVPRKYQGSDDDDDDSTRFLDLFRGSNTPALWTGPFGGEQFNETNEQTFEYLPDSDEMMVMTRNQRSRGSQMESGGEKITTIEWEVSWTRRRTKAWQ